MSLKDVLKAVKKEADSGKPSLVWAIDKFLTKERCGVREDDGYFHPSGLSDCARMEVYKKMGLKASAPGARLCRIFNNGTFVHDRIQGYLGDMGILKGNWYCDACCTTWWGFKQDACKCKGDRKCEPEFREVPIQDDKFKIRGHGDGIIVLGGNEYLLEIKSINGDQFKKLTGPLEHHIIQANVYMKVAKLKRVIFLYESKNTQELTEFIVDFDPKLATDCENLCQTVMDALAKEELPDRVCANIVEGKKRWCDACEICFSGMGFAETKEALK